VSDLSRYLFLAGGVHFVILGLAHALATPFRAGDRKGLAPSDASLSRAMEETPLRLTRRTDMWRAWVGFNFSHSLGAVFFGLAVWLVGRDGPRFAAESALFGPLAIVVACLYLVLAIKYWFRTPIVGCGVSVALFVASWAIRLIAP
jgi:hypothetical protein